VIRILTWNIQWGLGVDRRCDVARIARTARDLADFDVLCLQEVSAGMPDLEGCDGADQFAQIAALLPGYEAAEGVTVDVPGGPGRPRRRFGNMILSRAPLGRVIRHSLPWVQTEGSSMPRQMIEAVLLFPSGPLRVMTTHLEWSSSEARAAQVQAIRAAHAIACRRAALEPLDSWGPYIAQPCSASAVLAGDFNMTPDDPVKRAMSAPFDTSGAFAFRDAWEVLRPAEPQPATANVFDRRNGEPHCVDFVLVTEDLAPRLVGLEVFGEVQASDHQPVLLTLAA
jgi:endonuclease/exonuclease/phosphatase family metal-dependent hydrolase